MITAVHSIRIIICRKHIFRTIKLFGGQSQISSNKFVKVRWIFLIRRIAFAYCADKGQQFILRIISLRIRHSLLIFQQFQLLPRLDALKNVELPLIYAGVPPRERTRRAEEMLVRVGLKDRMHHYQNQLSGGQQQRVAIARALATNPTLLLADEPTGALDQATGEQVMALFRELNDEGRTIVMITHDLKIARHASRIVNILDGVLSEGVSAYD